MNKKTLPPPPDFDSPEEAKDIIHFLWIKLAELEDRLNQNSRNSSVPYHCQRQFKFDPLIDVIAEVKLTHPRY
ncbi:hypothetical protein [Vibrio alfacsensis]|uniref:hypothetical protein n=1 Tax=Vibrio alfacsensis TaxID=1074311 RepID=UPI004067F2D7